MDQMYCELPFAASAVHGLIIHETVDKQVQDVTNLSP